MKDSTQLRVDQHTFAPQGQNNFSTCLTLGLAVAITGAWLFILVEGAIWLLSS